MPASLSVSKKTIEPLTLQKPEQQQRELASAKVKPQKKQPVKTAKKAPQKPKKPRVTKAEKKVHKTHKRSTQLIPPLFGMFIMLACISVFNAQWISAQAIHAFDFQPHSPYKDGAPAPAADIHKQPTIIIPEIELEAPIIDDMQSHAEKDVQEALRRGVLHYGGTAEPGQIGNAVLFGHSSGPLWAAGDYKFVFTLLNKLKTNDRITVDYNGTRYTYKIVSVDTVPPTDFSVIQQTKKPTLTLITCTPVGTSKNRLVVKAEQVTPSPDFAKPSSANPSTSLSAGSLPQ